MTNPRERHCDALRPLLLEALSAKSLRVWVAGYLTIAGRRLDNQQKGIEILMLEDYLLDHSDLPGEEANLDLLLGYADAVRSIAQDETLSLRVTYNGIAWLMEAWRFLLDDSLKETDSLIILPMCSVIGSAVHAAAFRSIENGVRVLMHIVDTPLVLVRDAVVIGFRRMLAEDWTRTIYELRRYIHMGDVVQWVVAAASTAGANLLAEQERAYEALDILYAVMANLRRLPAGKWQEPSLDAARLMLPEAIAAILTALPESAFAALRLWLTWNHAEINALIAEGVQLSALHEHVEARQILEVLSFSP